MAIEPYRQRIGVVAGRGAIDPNLPRFADAGPAIDGLGKSLMASQESRLKDEAEQAALAAAGEARIVKDPKTGQYTRPPAPPGGGRVYMETYDRVLRERHAAVTFEESQRQLDRIGEEHFMDVEGATVAMDAYIGGVLETVPNDIRPTLEVNLNRELSERLRGIGHRKASNDRQVAVDGLAATRNANLDAGLRILSLGGADAERRAAIFFEAADRAEADLIAIGAMNEEAIAAGDLSLAIRAEDAADLGTVKTNARAIAAGLAGLSTPEQQTIEMWSAGARTNPDDRVMGMTFDDYWAQFPGEQGPVEARRIGTIAGGIARDRIAEQRAAEAERRADERARQQAADFAAAITEGMDGNYTFDQKQQRALDGGFLDYVGVEPGTSVDSFMGTPEGRARALEYAARTGYMPSTVKDYIESRIYSAGAPAVAELAQNLRQLVTDAGVQQGYRLFDSLSDKTKVAVHLVESLRRGGETEAAIAARVDDFLKAQAPTPAEIQSRFVQDGKNVYGPTRDLHIRKALGLSEKDRIPADVAKDYDNYMLWNLDIFGGDPARAARETAAQVSSGWAKSEIFVSGVGPRHFASLPLSIADLDEALLRFNGVPKGASFAPGSKFRARLHVDDAALGRYDVVIYNAQGHQLGAYPVDADALLREPLREATRRRRTAGQASIEAARGVRDARQRQVIDQSRNPFLGRRD